MMQDLQTLRDEALRHLAAAGDGDALEAWRIQYLGRKGAVLELLRGIPDLPADERPAFGQAANVLKQELTTAFEERQQAVAQTTLAAEMAAEGVDVTLPGRRPQLGRVHPSNETLREIYEIFATMGFQVFTSRDVETDRIQLRVAQHAARSPGARHVGHLLHDRRRACSAYAHQPRPDSRHAQRSAPTSRSA